MKIVEFIIMLFINTNYFILLGDIIWMIWILCIRILRNFAIYCISIIEIYPKYLIFNLKLEMISLKNSN